MKFLPKEQQNNQNLIQFLGDKDSQDLLPQLTYGSKLENLLKQKEGKTTLAIMKWIEENVPTDIREDVTFFRHFVRCILQILKESENESVEKQIFKEFVPALKSLSHGPHLQRNCLVETQLFCFHLKFPSGLIARIFEYLFNNKIVMAEVFIMWAEEDEGVEDGKKKNLLNKPIYG